MVSLKDVCTKDVLPFKTTPLRRPGLAVGLAYALAVPLSWLIYGLLNGLGITHVKIPIFLPFGLSYIIYHQWIKYAKSLKEKEEDL